MVLRNYIVRTRCVDLVAQELAKINPFYDFELELDDEIQLVKLRDQISKKVSLHRGDPYVVYEFRSNHFSFGVEDGALLKDYIRGVNGGVEQLNLEAYCVFAGQDKGLFQNIEDETFTQVVSRQEAPGYLIKMTTGMAIRADCPDCQERILKQVKLYKKRTATFDLKKGIQCPKCLRLLKDLISPCFLNCERSHKGEQGNGTIVDKTEWKPIQEDHILFWEEVEEYEQEVQQIVDWKELRIYIRVFETRYCTACQQLFVGEDDEDIEDRCAKGECGHRYHPVCFRQVSQGGEGICVAEGCNLILAEDFE